MQLCGSLSILWHCLSLGLEWKLTYSSPVATAEFSKFAGILSAALPQHHHSGFEIPTSKYLLMIMHCMLVTQSCPTLCDPMDCSLPGSSVHGIVEAIRLEWVAIPFSRRSSWPRDCVSCISRQILYSWANREAPWWELHPLNSQRASTSPAFITESCRASWWVFVF